MKILAGALIGGVVVAGVLIGAHKLKQSLTARQDSALYARAAGHLEAGTPRQGLKILLERPQLRPESQERWDSLEVQLAARIGAVSRLAAARLRNPKAVEAFPDAMLLIARGMLAAGDFEGYTQLRSRARELGHSTVRWQLVDADRLISEGRRAEALKDLNSIPAGSPQEPARLARLALLTASTDLASSWNYLAEAQRLDPRSPDVRLFRGQFLEAIGKHQLARLEYVAAMLSSPGNPWLADQLAEFYVRQGNYWSAQEIWEEASQNEGGDYLGVKWRFYQRLAGIDFQRGNETPPQAEKALSESGTASDDAMRFRKGLGVGRFWDEQAFEAAGGGLSSLAARPEVYWLRLLELLRTGAEAEASKMISDRVARATLRIPLPMLEEALAVTLSIRLGKPLPRLAAEGRDSGLAGKHEIFSRLESLRPASDSPRPVDPELERFLRGPQAFGGLVLAAGWMEGGLLLLGNPSNTLESPGWVQFGIAQAFRYLRGPKVALEFLRLERTARPAELALLEGENLLAVGQPEAARSVLEPLARVRGGVAERAAWLLAANAVRGTNRIQFESAARANPAFAASVAGRQFEAQLLLAERREVEATGVYTSIVNQSFEAKAFLARQSFAGGDLETCERLNAEMMELAPDNLELRNNLLLIRDRQGAR